MEEETYKKRYYSKGKYEAAIGIFATGIVFLFVAILSLILRRFGIDFIGLANWGYWMFIPAFFIILGGFQQVYRNSKYKKAVLVALMNRGNQGTHKLEHIAVEVGIKPNDLLRVLIDLREKGKTVYRFNPATGEIELGQKIVYISSEQREPSVKTPETQIISESKNFCIYCGHQIDKDTKFCPSCGSKL